MLSVTDRQLIIIGAEPHVRKVGFVNVKLRDGDSTFVGLGIAPLVPRSPVSSCTTGQRAHAEYKRFHG